MGVKIHENSIPRAFEGRQLKVSTATLTLAVPSSLFGMMILEGPIQDSWSFPNMLHRHARYSSKTMERRNRADPQRKNSKKGQM